MTCGRNNVGNDTARFASEFPEVLLSRARAGHYLKRCGFFTYPPSGQSPCKCGVVVPPVTLWRGEGYFSLEEPIGSS
jgi:hypothetical protein